MVKETRYSFGSTKNLTYDQLKALIDRMVNQLIDFTKRDGALNIGMFPCDTGALRESVLASLETSGFSGNSGSINFGSNLPYAAEVNEMPAEGTPHLRHYGERGLFDPNAEGHPFDAFGNFLFDRLYVNWSRVKSQNGGGI